MQVDDERFVFWEHVTFRLTFVARHGCKTQVIVTGAQHDNVVIKNSLRSKKIHMVLPEFTISQGVLLKKDILGRSGFVRSSPVSHGACFDRPMSGVCFAVFCGLWGEDEGGSRDCSWIGQRSCLGSSPPPCWIAQGGHLFCARICWTWEVASCCVWQHHSVWDPLSETLKE